MNLHDSDGYYQRGSTRKAQGDLDGALADFTEAIRLNPANVAAYDNRGNTWLVKGDFAQAIADYSEAIRQQPDHPGISGAYNNRAIARTMTGDLDGALADYDEAIRLNPGHGGHFSNRGEVHFVRGAYARARADFQQAIAVEPDILIPRVGQAIGITRWGRWPKPGSSGAPSSPKTNALPTSTGSSRNSTGRSRWSMKLPG